jgi:hypothetical protein
MAMTFASNRKLRDFLRGRIEDVAACSSCGV